MKQERDGHSISLERRMALLGVMTPALSMPVGARVLAPEAAFALGACCFGPDSSGSTTEAECSQDHGSWHGESSTCSVSLCSNLGACCQRATPSAPNGSCTDAVTETECESVCGKWA